MVDIQTVSQAKEQVEHLGLQLDLSKCHDTFFYFELHDWLWRQKDFDMPYSMYRQVKCAVRQVESLPH